MGRIEGKLYFIFPFLYLSLNPSFLELDALWKIAGIYPALMRPRTHSVDTNWTNSLINQHIW